MATLSPIARPSTGNRLMTPQEFKAKFPHRKEDINTNCLENIACPKCGWRGEVFIIATTEVEVVDNGTDTQGDVEWDEQSPCRCGFCHHRGVVQDFTVEGLDDFLSEMEDV